MKYVFTVALMLSSPFAGAKIPASHHPCPGDPKVVETVDLNRYAGKWSEIAHSPNSFQMDCKRSTAEYTVLSDSTASVYNVCYLADGTTRDISGVASVTDRATPAKLKVDFGMGPAGDYWIIALDSEYKWAVVSGPEKKSLFILARMAPMDKILLGDILQDLKSKGFDIDSLIFDKYEE